MLQELCSNFNRLEALFSLHIVVYILDLQSTNMCILWTFKDIRIFVSACAECSASKNVLVLVLSCIPITSLCHWSRISSIFSLKIQKIQSWSKGSVFGFKLCSTVTRWTAVKAIPSGGTMQSSKHCHCQFGDRTCRTRIWLSFEHDEMIRNGPYEMCAFLSAWTWCRGIFDPWCGPAVLQCWT